LSKEVIKRHETSIHRPQIMFSTQRKCLLDKLYHDSTDLWIYDFDTADAKVTLPLKRN